MNIKIIFLSIILAQLAWLTGSGQSYIIDSSYGINGIAQIRSTDTLNNYDEGFASTIEPNGKIAFIHHHYDDTDSYHLSPGIIRFLPNGLSVDSLFGTLGVATKTLLPLSAVSLFNYNRAASIYYSGDGGYLIGAQKKRYNFNDYTGCAIKFNITTGQVDGSFGNSGVHIDSTYQTYNAFEIHPKIGSGYLQLSRDRVTNENVLSALKPNGDIDSSFGNNGFQFFNMFSMPFEDNLNRSISIINNAYYISFATVDSNTYLPKHSGFIKLKPNGTPDTSYGINGRVIVNSHTKNKFIEFNGYIISQNLTTAIAQNNIVVKMIDTTTSNKYISLYNTLGYMDSTFGINGYSLFYPPQNTTSTTAIQRLNVLNNGKIVVVGITADTAVSPWVVKTFVAIYKPNGLIDSSFGVNGYYLLTNILPDASLHGNILSLDSNCFYITGVKKDTNSPNYFDGFYCIIKFRNGLASPTSITPSNNIDELNVYPNPISNIVTIKSNYILEKVDITDLNGKIIFTDHPNQNAIRIDIQNFPPALYILKVKAKNREYTKKLIKYRN